MKPHTSPLLLAMLTLWLLAACERQTGFDETASPVALSPDTLCFYTGLRLIDFAGPKAQLQFDGEEPRFYVDPVKLFHVLLNPDDRLPTVRTAFVQDMSGKDWYQPEEHWIDARTAWYVKDSAMIGPLGPTLAAFASETAAASFIAEHGGSLLRFADIDTDLVAIDGGALHDTSM